jgi:hypothetical protein
MGNPSHACRDHRAIAPDHLDGQRVDTRLEFGIESFHHGAMLLQAGLSGEVRSGNSDAEVSFATRPRTGVTLVSVALIEHFKMGWSEFLGKFFNNRIANGHMDTGSGQVGDKA